MNGTIIARMSWKMISSEWVKNGLAESVNTSWAFSHLARPPGVIFIFTTSTPAGNNKLSWLEMAF